VCETCGCAVTPESRTVEVLTDLLQANDRQADENRRRLGEHGLLGINLMSSPGAGKTSLLEATLGPEPARAAVIEGDLATERDADRLRRRGIDAIQITTGSACHLDASMVAAAMDGLALDGRDYLFIENVGNLVCPASFDLGQHLNVVLLSVPEGDDKPAKYPVMFRAADLVLVTKADLWPHCAEFSVERVRSRLHDLARDVPVIEVSARSGAGLKQWKDWLEQAVVRNGQRLARGEHRRPAIQSDGARAHGLTAEA